MNAKTRIPYHYEIAFEEIIKSEVEKHPTFHSQWLHREENDAFRPVVDMTGRGDGPFDSPEKVLAYCMLYMHAHYEANRVPLKRVTKTFNGKPRVAMLDFGCGPMTAALALADLTIERFNSPLWLNYIGVDISNEMLTVAKQFSKRTDCFESTGHIHFVNSITEICERHLDKWAAGASHLVVACSYILSQKDLRLSDIDELVGLLDRIRKLANGRDVWIVYTNARTSSRPNKFSDWVDRCQEQGIRFGWKVPIRVSHQFRQHRLENGKIEHINSRPDNLVYLATRLKVE